MTDVALVDAAPLLALERVSAGYGHTRGSERVVHEVSLQLHRGEMVALIGPNGAGKSSLLRVVSGVLRPDTGRALLDGRDLAQMSARDLAQRVAVVAQESAIPSGLFVREMVSLGRTPYARLLLGPTAQDRHAVDWAITAAGIENLASRFVDELSGGERQRVILARALAQQPDLLLLDEPTANLDLHHQVAMLELVRGLTRSRGLTVLAAVHDLQLAALYCDQVALLDHGRLVSHGSPEHVLTPELLLTTFGQQVVLAAHPTHGVPLVALVPNGNARRVTEF